jgi:ribosome recycling factor
VKGFSSNLKKGAFCGLNSAKLSNLPETQHHVSLRSIRTKVNVEIMYKRKDNKSNKDEEKKRRKKRKKIVQFAL